MKRSKSIIFKLSALIIGVFTLLFLIFAISISFATHKETVDNAEKISLADAERVALRLSEQFQRVDESMNTTKRVLETMNETERMAASDVLAILKANLDGDPNAMGMAVVFEKGMLVTDTLVAEQKKMIDEKGRFGAYLLKTEDGSNIITPASGYDTPGEGDWYLVPKNEKKSFIQEPTTYEENGKTTTLTMLSVPLLTKNGEFMGVLTTSMSLNFLEDLTKNVAPEGGYASVITDSGTLLMNSINQKMNGTNMNDAIDWQPVKDALNRGETAALYVESKTLGERAYNSFAPIRLVGFEERWSVQTVLPRSKIVEIFTSILTIIIFAGLIMMVLMGIVTAWFIFRQIKPLANVQKSMESAASGDLSDRVDESRLKQDEIGSVATSYNYMLNQTNGALAEVLEASTRLTHSSTRVNHAFEEIVASSQEVSVATEEIAHGASKQSEDTEETSLRIGGLADQITAISSLSENMDNLSRQSIEATQTGMVQVSHLREQNEATNGMNEQVEQQMHLLTEKISGINQVITSIQDIASQTNLLALNASIEAARAGEHGKGFAVVAEEVRKLAEQSNSETGTIQKTVQEILEQSRATVEVISQNTRSMKKQSESVTGTEESFARNTKLTNEMNKAIANLSAKLFEMVSNKDQAILAIQSVSAISEETAASAEQVSASSVTQQQELERVADSVQQMTQIAIELQQIVERFKLA